MAEILWNSFGKKMFWYTDVYSCWVHWINTKKEKDFRRRPDKMIGTCFKIVGKLFYFRHIV